MLLGLRLRFLGDAGLRSAAWRGRLGCERWSNLGCRFPKGTFEFVERYFARTQFPLQHLVGQRALRARRLGGGWRSGLRFGSCGLGRGLYGALIVDEPEPPIVVTTAGPLGGWIRPGGPFRAAPLPGPVSDAYGCGDCFAAGLTYGLALGKPVDEAVALAARCGAAVLTGRGAYGHQLTADDVRVG